MMMFQLRFAGGMVPSCASVAVPESEGALAAARELEEHRPHDARVIVQRQHAVDAGDQGEQVELLLDHRGEEIELADEAGADKCQTHKRRPERVRKPAGQPSYARITASWIAAQ